MGGLHDWLYSSWFIVSLKNKNSNLIYSPSSRSSFLQTAKNTSQPMRFVLLVTCPKMTQGLENYRIFFFGLHLLLRKFCIIGLVLSSSDPDCIFYSVRCMFAFKITFWTSQCLKITTLTVGVRCDAVLLHLKTTFRRG